MKIYRLIGILVLVVVALVAYLAIHHEQKDNLISPEADRVLVLVNHTRQEHGEVPLVMNQQLMRAAKAKADDMANRHYFSHTTPENKHIGAWLEEEGYDYRFAGENLARGYSSTEQRHEAWLESQAHFQVMTNPEYKDTGIWVRDFEFEGKNQVLVVEFFGKK